VALPHIPRFAAKAADVARAAIHGTSRRLQMEGLPACACYPAAVTRRPVVSATMPTRWAGMFFAYRLRRIVEFLSDCLVDAKNIPAFQR